ncbi:MAG TPA: hypothetical protein VFM43_00585 [Gaiellaceae bacterium]|nr:hypothetical protein [Gaiellaceae bacterium]
MSAKGWWAVGLASVGVLWTAALIPGAFFFPAYRGETLTPGGARTHTTATLVGVNGLWVVTPFVLFLCLSVVAWVGLHASCATGSRRWRTVGNVAAGLLAAAAILTFSAGFLAIPAALLVVVAAALTPARQAREM